MLQMKRLSVVLATATLVFSMATAQNQDVDPSHWAYKAVDELVRAGIIVGYPDGTFKGTRTLTRYEFAEALYKAWMNLRGWLDQRMAKMDELEREINALKARPTGGGATQPPVNLGPINSRLDELNREMAGLRGMQDAVNRMERLAQTFQQELNARGVDVDALKRDYASLANRVSELEKMKGPQLTGTFGVGVYGPHGIDGSSAFGLNGQSVGAQGSILNGTEVFHELRLGYNAMINDDVSAHAMMSVGNYLPAIGNAGMVGGGYTPGNTDITIWEGYVKAPVDLFGKTLNLTVGRMPVMVSPLTLARVNPDYYLQMPGYNDRQYRVDGASGMIDFGRINLSLWAARTNTVRSNNSSGLLDSYMNFTAGGMMPITNAGGKPVGTMGGMMTAEQMAGVRANINLFSGDDMNGTLGLTYFAVGGPSAPLPTGAAGTFNRVDVFGADLKGKARRISYGAEFAASLLYNDDTKMLDDDNWAAYGWVGYDFGENLNISVGAKEVRFAFGAPGSWGRIGNWYNPTDISGFMAKASYQAGENLSFRASGEFYEGADGGPGLRTTDKINRVMAGVDYKFNERWSAMFNYEGVMWELKSATWAGGNAGAEPIENYFTLGLGYNLGENATLNVMYQVIDFDAKGAPAFAFPTTGRNKGGVASTTLSVKF